MSPLFLMTLAAPSFAAAPTIAVTAAPRAESEVTLTQPWYLMADESVVVEGDVSGLSAANANGYSIFVNGIPTSLDCGVPIPANIDLLWLPTGATSASFLVTAPVGTDGPDWWIDYVTTNCPGVWSEWPDETPHVGWLQDDERVLRPVVMELMDLDTFEIVSRARFMLYDTRRSTDLITDERRDTEVQGMWAQLSPAGLDALEPVYLSMQPWPSADTLQANIDAQIPFVESRAIEAPNSACFDLAGTEFEGLAEYSTGGVYDDEDTASALVYGTPTGLGVFEEALALYNVYDRIQQAAAAGGPIGGLVATAINTQNCVKTLPTAADFEVCVGSVSQTVTAMSVGDISATDLSFLNGGSIAVASTLADVDADVEGHLQDVHIRYKHRTACSLAPGADVDLTDTSGSRDWLDEWSTCTDLDFDAASLTRVEVDGDDSAMEIDVYVDPSDPEGVYAECVAPVGFGANAVTVSAGEQTCSEDWIVETVEELLAEWEPDVEYVGQIAWDDGLPSTGESQTLDFLLDPLELGAYEPVDHTLDAELEPVATTKQGGLEVTYRTNTEVRATSGLGVEPPYWLYREGDGPSFRSDGEDVLGIPFDVSFTVTTGYLNQVLRSLSASGKLVRATIRPSYADLGITSGVGNANRPAKLTPTNLAYVHSALGGITPAGVVNPRKQAALNLVVWPRMAPFVTMRPDYAGGAATYTAPLQLELGQLVVELREDGRAGRDSGLWVRLEADLWEPDLTLSLDPDAGLLVPSLSEDREWTYTIVDTNVPACSRSLRTDTSCEREVEDALGALVEPYLDEMILDLFAELPAPLIWNAGGLATTVPTLVELHRYQAEQAITWTADFTTAYTTF